MPVKETLADVTDALARGRLAIAEIAGMDSRELDAVYSMACARLDVGHDAAAATILAGLVALFPFAARYWRAYGVALHRLAQWQSARHAYDAVLLLDGEHALTLFYRAEVAAHLGMHEQAQRDLERAASLGDATLRKRARDLSSALKTAQPQASACSDTGTEVTRTCITHSEDPQEAITHTFVLHDARCLPLADGAVAAAEAMAVVEATVPGTALPSPATGETTALVTATTAAPTQTRVEVVSEPIAVAERERTNTALLPRRRVQTVWDAVVAPTQTEITHTAVVRRNFGDVDEDGT